MERYEILGPGVHGTYGTVFRCRDIKGPSEESPSGIVAVKAFETRARDGSEQGRQVLSSAVQEVGVLKRLNAIERHPNIVRLHQAYRSSTGRIYMVMEYLPTALSTLIKDQQQRQQGGVGGGGGLSPRQVTEALYQLLQAVRFLHKHKVIHRDLKPANIMFDSRGVLKLVDFGLSKQYERGTCKEDLSPYVMTRWYRAPELLVGAGYGPEIDIWAVGCIAAEMVLSEPLFPGTTWADQWHLILQCFGRSASTTTATTTAPDTSDLCDSLPQRFINAWEQQQQEEQQQQQGQQGRFPVGLSVGPKRFTSLGHSSSQQLQGTFLDLLTSACNWSVLGFDAYDAPDVAKAMMMHSGSCNNRSLLSRLRSSPHGRDLSSDLLEVIAACLQPDPLKRPTAQELLGMNRAFEGVMTTVGTPSGPATPDHWVVDDSGTFPCKPSSSLQAASADPPPATFLSPAAVSPISRAPPLGTAISPVVMMRARTDVSHHGERGSGLAGPGLGGHGMMTQTPTRHCSCGGGTSGSWMGMGTSGSWMGGGNGQGALPGSTYPAGSEEEKVAAVGGGLGGESARAGGAGSIHVHDSIGAGQGRKSSSWVERRRTVARSCWGAEGEGEGEGEGGGGLTTGSRDQGIFGRSGGEGPTSVADAMSRLLSDPAPAAVVNQAGLSPLWCPTLVLSLSSREEWSGALPPTLRPSTSEGVPTSLPLHLAAAWEEQQLLQQIGGIPEDEAVENDDDSGILSSAHSFSRQRSIRSSRRQGRRLAGGLSFDVSRARGFQLRPEGALLAPLPTTFSSPHQSDAPPTDMPPLPAASSPSHSGLLLTPPSPAALSPLPYFGQINLRPGGLFLPPANALNPGGRKGPQTAQRSFSSRGVGASSANAASLAKTASLGVTVENIVRCSSSGGERSDRLA